MNYSVGLYDAGRWRHKRSNCIFTMPKQRFNKLVQIIAARVGGTDEIDIQVNNWDLELIIYKTSN